MLAALSVTLVGLGCGAGYAALAVSAGSSPHKPKITSGPQKVTNQSSADFTYSSKRDATFICSLDGGAYAPCGDGTSGSITYAGPLADGRHSFQVEAQAGTSTSGPATRRWTIDTVPPPPPVFTKAPGASTTHTKAHFAYRDDESRVGFTCELDGDPYASCDSEKTYKDLPPGSHTFCVRAHDKAGNAGAAACLTWLVGAGELGFSIAGSPLPGALLYPSGRTVPINLVFTNPNPTPVTVQSVTVSVTGTSALGCDAGSFTVRQQLIATPTVPADSTTSLQDVGVAQADWPQLVMVDTGNQDACQNATVDLAYSGTAGA
jgi:hypothetical protein